MATRPASHAGSWYIGSKQRLDDQLDGFLANVVDEFPVKGARVLIGPHAGYTYAGQTLAEAYKAWDVEKIKRIFIMGPSHYLYFQGAMLTQYAKYETPLGDVPVDIETTAELEQTGLFKYLPRPADEEEHSIEMHAPFIYKMTQGTDQIVRPIIPILIGHTGTKYDKQLAKVLAGYFNDEENAFIISTDFCHWGSRFDYTSYTTLPDCSDIRTLSRISSTSIPIHKSIEHLDRLAMKVASQGSYDKWNAYIKETENTICGRRPLGILLNAIELSGSSSKLQWIGYKQSSKARDVHDSSVSYASGYAVA